jgi:G8 domain-containing protein
MALTRWHVVAMCAAVSSVGYGWHTSIRSHHLATGTVGRARDPHPHRQPLSELDASEASHVAVRSGDWSDPETWSAVEPTAGARVVIPRGVTVTVTAPVAAPLEWVRVDGRLDFSPVDSSQLTVSTMLVASTGALSIGTADRTVDAAKTVSLLFAPRSAAVRRRDRSDMLGGLIVQGHASIHGTTKAGFATPSNVVVPGLSALTFATPPAGWSVGDELLFPAADAASDDERRQIASIADDGTSVTLSSPLRFGHASPAGVRADVPVANLTRNIVLASTDTSTLRQRAHVMVMTHEAVHISGVAFRGLGRTTTSRPHTLPTVNENGDVSAGDNPIGRYAVHFHLASGASRRMAPHVFTGNVIAGSPKHGLVNHGGYVVAEDNVTYAIDGSHFFAENGSEIGAFRHNLAVFSRGSGEHIEGRQAGIGDFGHGGHGFWSNSPAVVMEHNYAFHHAGPAYVIFAAPIEAAEGTQNVFFRGAETIANFLQDNLDPPLRDIVTARQIAPTTIPFRFAGNVAANAERGLEIWHTDEVAEHNLESIVDDCVFWQIRAVGIGITYGVNTVVRNSVLIGSGADACRAGGCDWYMGISNEGTTRNLTVDHVRIAAFFTGIWVPSRGTTRITRSDFDNKFNILSYPPHQPGRSTIIEDNTFARHADDGEDYHFVQGRNLFHGDLSMVFERDPLIVKDDRFPGKTLYRFGQYPAAIPFRDSGIPELDGKTAVRIRREYGLALGGVLAPADATRIAGIGGFVGGPPVATVEMADEEQMLARTERLQAGAGEGYTSNADQGYGTDCCNIHRLIKGRNGERSGWRFLTERRDGIVTTKLTYIDTRPPRFEIDPRIRLEIHPDDVNYGFLIQGTLFDEGAGPEIVRRTYDALKVDDNGYVNVPFEYPDRAGNLFRRTYRLTVTTRAARRGSDLMYFVHRTAVH